MVEIAVFETGMGGRLDATNILNPLVTVLTSINYDHREFLGATLQEIAGEKAGIIKPGVPVVSSRQEPDAETVIRARAGKNNAGISGLPVLDAMNILGATVDCQTARIGEGDDTYESGIISAVNERARTAGVEVGMTTAQAAKLMLTTKKAGAVADTTPVVYDGENGRIVLADTLSYVNETHRGCVVIQRRALAAGADGAPPPSFIPDNSSQGLPSALLVDTVLSPCEAAPKAVRDEHRTRPRSLAPRPRGTRSPPTRC